MALCCIGGVCVPYSAIIPLALMGLRWLVSKLANHGLLPKFLVKFLGAESVQTLSTCSTPQLSKSSSCCSLNTNTSNGNPCTVFIVQSIEDYETFLCSNPIIVIKFTATWCAPCKKMAPVYNDLSLRYSKIPFLEVDVDCDGCSSLASRFGVRILPTVVLVKVGTCAGRKDKSMETTVLGTLTGSDRAKLCSLLETHLGAGQ